MLENDSETKILEAATDRFMAAGLYKVTMDEIASDLRMSKKTVYKFFPSKELLLKAIVQSLMHRVESEVATLQLVIVAFDGQDVRAVLKILFPTPQQDVFRALRVVGLDALHVRAPATVHALARDFASV